MYSVRTLNKFSSSGRNADKRGQTDRQKDRSDKANRRFSLFMTEQLKYKLTIKSFPEYKHLLQENYVEYKHIFFTITKVNF